MRISDWSSDVCSSDLVDQHHRRQDDGEQRDRAVQDCRQAGVDGLFAPGDEEERDHDPEQRHDHQVRSEEHTSELQSLMRISYAVFCLKKKTTTQYHIKKELPEETQTIHTTPQS